MESIKLIITADQTADIGKTLRDEQDIHIFNYHIMTDKGDFLDGIEIKAQNMLMMMSELPKNYTAASSTTSEYAETFKRFLDLGFCIVHLASSSKLCPGHSAALQALLELEESGCDTSRLFIIDTQLVSVSVTQLCINLTSSFRNPPTMYAVIADIKGLLPKIGFSVLSFSKNGEEQNTNAEAFFRLKKNMHKGNYDSVELKDGALASHRRYQGSKMSCFRKFAYEKLAKLQFSDFCIISCVYFGKDKTFYEECVNYLMRNYSHFKVVSTEACCSTAAILGNEFIGLSYIKQPLKTR